MAEGSVDLELNPVRYALTSSNYGADLPHAWDERCPLVHQRRIAALACIDAPRRQIVRRHHKSAARPCRPRHGRHLRLCAAPICRRRQTRRHFGAAELPTQNDVRHAPDGIRAVKRGRTVGHHLDSIHRAQGNGRDIDPLGEGVVSQAMPVEQCERRVRSKSSQIERGRGTYIVVVALGSATRDTRVLATIEILRQEPDVAAEIRCALPFNFISRTNCDRRGRRRALDP